MRIALLVIVSLAFGMPAVAKEKQKEWCFGNGCLQQTGNWHECKKGELNVCRQWAKEKPSY